MIVVTKFGGSSLSCATQFKKVYDIIKSDSNRKVVVASALGKRNSSDTKITDLLYILHAHIMYSVDINEIWDIFYNRFTEVRDELKLDYQIEDDLNELKNELKKNIDVNYLISRGEYFTAKLLSKYLGYKFVDAKDIIVFDYNGKVNYALTEKLVKEQYDDLGIVVPGFYGAYENGGYNLFSRGGSDITGSILAGALHASLYENWTDVSGIMMADPRIVKNPKVISEITYHELRELSYMGANVLHEETIFPVQGLNIPIKLLNTNSPLDKGTIITKNCSDTSNLITGIAGKKDFIGFTIYKSHLSNEVGFMSKVIDVFVKHKISIEHVPTGIDNLTIVVSKASVEKIQFDVLNDINLAVEPDNIVVSDDIALIAIVGRNMAGKKGLSGKIFAIFGNHGINIRMIAQGPDELNIIVGVDNNMYDNTIKILYDELSALSL